jgi:hypothetical protein
MLPSLDERDWCIEALAELIRQRGPAPLLAEPLAALPPAPEGGAPALIDHADQLVRLMLEHVGLGQLSVRVKALEPDSRPYLDDAWGARHPLSWFGGLENGCLRFGLDRQRLVAQGLTGALALEVALAYRAAHGLTRPHRMLEENLAEATAVYLGLGVLVTTGRPRPAAEGYLSPQALPFLLAVQARLRRMPRPELLAKVLGANSTGPYREALASLADDAGPDEEPLAVRVGLVPRPPRSPRPEAPVDEGPAPEPVVMQRALNGNRPVFRVKGTQSVRGGLLGAALGAAAGIAAGAWAVLGLGLAGLGAGALLGRQRRRDVCADPRCRTALGPGARVCPGCGGRVLGEVARPAERIDREQALQRFLRKAMSEPEDR